MKVSPVVTKIVVRVFFVLVFFALVPFLVGDQTPLKHIYLSFHHWWELIFPAIIIVSFIILVVACAIKRYKQPDLNWLLVVNTIVLAAYGIALFIHVAHLL
jgi:quinol-cytochrome oxidoreductase complex cytochrome b subunit